MKMNKKTLLIRLLLCAVIVFSGIVSIFPENTYAQSESKNTSGGCDTDFYSSNNIMFYDPCEKTVTCGPGQVVVNGTPQKLSDIEVAKKVYEFLTGTPLSSNGGKPMTPIQASGVIGNFQQESSLRPGVENEIGAVGLGQWLGGRRTALEEKARSMGTTWSDINAQMQHLKTELEGTESAVMTDQGFSVSQDIAVVTKRWAQVFERMGEWEAHYDTRTAYATEAMSLFGGSVASGNSCGEKGGVVQGDLVKTAIGFALTTPASNGMIKLEQARETYPPAMEQYNYKGKLADFKGEAPPWTDCGRFVSTSLRASGVDPNFPEVYVPTLWQYGVDHPDKYEIIKNISFDILKPGDILVSGGHITIYTGEATYPMVDASYGDRVPSVRSTADTQYMVNSANSNGYGLMRLKK